MADGLSIGSLSVSGGLTRLTGTSSKLDTEAIVAATYAAKRQPAVRLEQRISRNEARSAALGELKGLLQNLRDVAAGLRNPPGLLGGNDNVFETKQVFVTGGGSVPAAELVGIGVGNGAASGGFTLEVERLATAHKLAAQPLGGSGQTLATAWNGGGAFAGTLDVGLFGGTKIAVDDSMSADDLRAAINAVSAQTGVSASVLSVSASDRRLVLSAAETGREIELVDTGGDGITALMGATALQEAQTALITVDGVAIERSSNHIDDILPGVTIDLYRAEPGAEISVEVEPSLAAAKEHLVGLVSAYNGLRDFVAQHSAVGAGGQVAEDAVLFGDRMLRALAQNLGGMLGSAVPGLPPGALSTLRDVGISFDGGGRLRLDEATLDSRLLARLDEVRRVFEFTSTASSGAISVYARSNALSDFTFSVSIIDADADDRPEAATLDGVPAAIDGRLIKGVEGTAYEGLKLIWTGQGDSTIDLAVSPGLADQLYNALDEALDQADGPIERSLAGIDAANEDFARQIERIEERASRARELLVERLGAMESALSLANTMLSQVRAQMDAMNQPS